MWPGVGPRGAANGRLIDVDDLVEVLQTVDALVAPGPDLDGTVQIARKRLADYAVYKGGFSPNRTQR